jgi:hypothetical protein
VREEERRQETDLTRRDVLRAALAVGGALALGGCGAMGTGSSAAPLAAGAGGIARLSGGEVSVRWLGGGVVELATPDYKQIAYGDAWFWSNAGWTRFNIPKAAEYSSKEAFAQ